VTIDELRSVSVTVSVVVVTSATTWRTRFLVACSRQVTTVPEPAPPDSTA
jgi:hypothetical protein